MNHRPDTALCTDEIQEITVKLPCQLVKRVERYANENGNTVTGVIIEALDTLLRGEKMDLSGW